MSLPAKRIPHVVAMYSNGSCGLVFADTFPMWCAQKHPAKADNGPGPGGPVVVPKLERSAQAMRILAEQKSSGYGICTAISHQCCSFDV